MKRALITAVITLLLVEIVCRLSLVFILGASFFNTKTIYHQFYPELKSLEQYSYDEERINLLVLAGSVLYEDSIIVEVDQQEVTTWFCGPARHLEADRFNVVNLAQPGHNTLDSWVKYKILPKRKRFDKVMVYHGINDCRTNNIAKEKFDAAYRHVEFYDDLSVVLSHPEMKAYVTPLLLHWLWHSIRKRSKDYIPRELFIGLLTGEPEDYVLKGDHVSSAQSFEAHLSNIHEESNARNEELYLATYASYIPSNYDLIPFNRRQLDYVEHIYPVELYGLQEHIKPCLKVHNEVVETVATLLNIKVIDFYNGISIEGASFNDVCHLSEAGCVQFTAILTAALSE